MRKMTREERWNRCLYLTDQAEHYNNLGNAERAEAYLVRLRYHKRVFDEIAKGK